MCLGSGVKIPKIFVSKVLPANNKKATSTESSLLKTAAVVYFLPFVLHSHTKTGGPQTRLYKKFVIPLAYVAYGKFSETVAYVAYSKFSDAVAYAV